MSATARMHLLDMILLRHSLEITGGRLQLLLHRFSSNRRENAYFLDFDGIGLHRREPWGRVIREIKLPSDQLLSSSF
jgi:hypothetical protein